jgi:hypothetical protein
MGVVRPEMSSSWMEVMPTAVVCEAPTAGSAFESSLFLPDRVTEVRSMLEERPDSEGLPVSCWTAVSDVVRSDLGVGASRDAKRLRISSSGLSIVPLALLLAKDVRRLLVSARYGRSLLRSAFASTPTVRGLMKTV